MTSTLNNLSSLAPYNQISFSRRYFALLVETFEWVARKLVGIKELQRETMHLYTEVLAISFIRIPCVQECIIKCAVTHKFLPVVDPLKMEKEVTNLKVEVGDGGKDTIHTRQH